MVARVSSSLERDIIPPSAVTPATGRVGHRRFGVLGGRRLVGCRMVPDTRSRNLSIAEKELIPIILACDAWGRAWHGVQVLCHCDNQVVVAAMRSRTSRSPGLMHLVRSLLFVEAQHNCHLHPTYINTKANHLADDLSRDNALSFLSKVPEANPQPSPVSLPLLDLLLDPQADWTSPAWRHRFSGTSRPV